MNMVVAADKNWAIGKDQSLLVVIPADHKTFRNMTVGKTVIMGRKTLESLPGGRPLELRKNIVLSRNKDYQVRSVTVVHSIEELFRELGEEKEDAFVIGGGSVYQELLPYCDTVHVTRINQSYEADTYFPDLDKSEEWEITAESEEQTYFDLEYVFVRYERVKEKQD